MTHWVCHMVALLPSIALVAALPVSALSALAVAAAWTLLSGRSSRAAWVTVVPPLLALICRR